MENSIVRISLDVQATNSAEIVTAKQGDTARRVIIALMDGGFPYRIADGCTVAINAVKPDKTRIFNSCAVEDNRVIYQMTAQTTSVAGRVLCELKVYGSDDMLLTSARFGILVDKALSGDIPVSEDEVDVLTHLISEAGEAVINANGTAAELRQMAEDGEFDGELGPTGLTPNIQVGTVESVPYTEPAEVSRSGTNENPVFSFKIPEGKQGEPGEAGRTPQKGVDYFDGLDGYSPSASVERTDSGAIVKITDKNGTTTAVLKDGENGKDAVVDPTLSKPKQAAEAQATGIAVENLESRVTSLESEPQIPPSVELRLRKLEAVAEGNLFMFWSDSTEGYSKTVPGDVLRYATLDKIGGRTAVQDGVPVRADVESVVCEGININSTGIELGHYVSTNGEKRTATSAKDNYAGMLDKVKCLPNTAYTVALFGIKSDSAIVMQRAWYDSSGSFIARTSTQYQVGLDGTLTYRFTTTDSTGYLYCYAYSAGGLQMSKDAGLMIAEGADIPYTPYVQREYPIPSEVRSLPGYGETGAIVDFEGKTYTAPDNTQKDISDMLPDGFENIEVEVGGRITFRQSGGLELPVPNQETYMIKLGGRNT